MLEPSGIILGTSVLLGLGVLVALGVLYGLGLYLSAIWALLVLIGMHPMRVPCAWLVRVP